MLTLKQARTLRFIDRYTRENDGVSPTYREISAHLGLRSASGIFRIMAGLEERGFIRRLAKRSRAIEVIRKPPENAPPWSPISTLPDTKELVWLLNLLSGVAGPRPPEPADIDRFDYWAMCSPPLPLPSTRAMRSRT